jgi:hypothetical protein
MSRAAETFIVMSASRSCTAWGPTRYLVTHAAPVVFISVVGHLEVDEGLAELLALLRVLQHIVQGGLRLRQRHDGVA